MLLWHDRNQIWWAILLLFQLEREQLFKTSIHVDIKIAMGIILKSKVLLDAAHDCFPLMPA